MKTNQISVDSEKKREQWIDLLYSAVNFHKMMAIQLEDEIKIASPSWDDDMNIDQTYHAALANGIREAIWLIEEWEIEDESTTDSDD
tara:strand:- start:635 stop:895 length:261 start_codon:yes stop_codon:yes gene_type:complete